MKYAVDNPLGKYVRLTCYGLLFVTCLSVQPSLAQIDPFAPDTIAVAGFIRADRPDEQIANITNPDGSPFLLEVTESGCYDIWLDTEYGGTEQNNESYYVQLRDESGAILLPMDPNAGPYKVVVDDTVSGRHLSWRNVGHFELLAGMRYLIEIHHYAVIDEALPIFRNPPGIPVRLTGAASLDITQLTLTPASAYDIDLELAVDRFSLVAGQTLTLTMSVRNLGPCPAQEVILTNSLPSLISPVDFDLPPQTATGDSVVWEISQLLSGDTIEVSFTGQIDTFIPQSPIVLTDRATVSADFDTLTANNTTSISVQARRPPPRAPTLSLSSDSVCEKDSILLSVATPVELASWDLLVYYDNGEVDSTFADDFIAATDLQANLPVTVTPAFVAKLRLENTIADTIRIEMLAQDVFGNTTRTQQQLVVNRGYDLEMRQSVEVDTVEADGVIDYRLAVTNLAGCAAEGIEIIDFLPPFASALEFDPAPAAITADSVKWEIPALQSGDLQEFRLTLRVDRVLPETIVELSNRSLVRAAFDTVASNNADATTIIGIRPPGTSPELVLSSSTVCLGEPVTITVRSPREMASWDLWVIYADSTIDSTFADAFISTNPLLPDQSLRIEPEFLPERPIKGFTEPVRFELRSVDLFGNSSRAAAELVVRDIYDLRLTQFASVDTVRAGERYALRIVLANTGPCDATGIIISSELPGHVTPSDYDLAPTFQSSDSVRWDLERLAAGDSLEIAFDLSVAPVLPASLPLITRTQLRAAQDSDSTNNAVATIVEALKQEGRPPLIESGTPVVCVGDGIRLRVKTPVEVRTWQVWVYFADGTIDSVTYDRFAEQNVLIPNVWLLLSPLFRPLELKGAAFSEFVTFEVRIEDEFGNLESGRTRVLVRDSNDLEIMQTVGVEQVAPGDKYTYELIATNNGFCAARDAVIRDFLPPFVEVFNFSLPPTAILGDSLEWQLGRISPGDTIRLTFDAQVSLDLPQTVTLINKSIIQASQDSMLSNNMATTSVEARLTEPARPQLALEGDQICLGDSIGVQIYTNQPVESWDLVVVRGNGTIDSSYADEFIAHRELQAGVWQRVEPSYYPQSLLGTGVSERLVFELHVIDRAGNRSTARDTILLYSGYDLALEQTIEHDTVTAGERYFNLLQLHNLGPCAATDVVLQHILPAYVRIDRFSVSPTTVNDDTLVWRIHTIAPDDSFLVSMEAVVDVILPDALVELRSVARVVAPSDTNSSNDRVTTVLYGIRPAGRPPQIEASPAIVDAGQPVTVAVRVLSEISRWDLLVRYGGNGAIDSSYADAFISSNLLLPDRWTEVTPPFTGTILTTQSREERLYFELQTIDQYGNFGRALDSVLIRGGDDLILEENVFRPERDLSFPIHFKLNSEREVSLDIYDVAGTHITRLADRSFGAGWNTFNWNGVTDNGKSAGSGVYVVTLRAGPFKAWKKFMVVR